MTEAEMKVMHLQAKDCRQTPEGKRGNKGFLQVSEGAWPCDTFILNFQPPEL